MAFNQHKVQEATDLYIGKEYLQHNPTVADGGQAFADAFAPFLKENPQSRAEIKRVIAEGDLVMLHVFSRTLPQDKGEAVVDIFCFDNEGEIVEHWDAIQPMPEKKHERAGDVLKMTNIRQLGKHFQAAFFISKGRAATALLSARPRDWKIRLPQSSGFLSISL